jgi:membrane dipeptidase
MPLTGLAGIMAKAVAPDDVGGKKAGRFYRAFRTNGVPLRQQWKSTRDEVQLIRLFHQRGVRMMHLTYDRRNPLGDGPATRTTAG